MDSKFSDMFIQQCDTLISKYRELRGRSQFEDLSDLENAASNQLITQIRAAVERIAGRDSVYVKQVESALEKYGHNNAYNVPILGGILEALRADLEAGYLKTVEELIHADLFADFIEMASYLLSENYKDAAAVIGGSTLEAHLRQLCQKHSIEIDLTSAKGVRPKKADLLNSDLAKSNVYSKLDLKNVTAWLDLRNNAAHGKYDEYTREQVAVMISGIRDFLTRNPA